MLLLWLLNCLLVFQYIARKNEMVHLYIVVVMTIVISFTNLLGGEQQVERKQTLHRRHILMVIKVNRLHTREILCQVYTI